MQRDIGRLIDGRDDDVDDALDRLFGVGVRPLRIDEAVFEAMLEAWARQQRTRMLREATIRSGVALVARVRESSERWPWEWSADDLEKFFSDLASAPYERRPATLRNYQSQRARLPRGPRRRALPVAPAVRRRVRPGAHATA